LWILVLLAVVAGCIYWLSGWSRLNCWTREINISTGHQRYTRYWFWCETERTVEPTWVSAALNRSLDEAEVEEDWRLVVTLSPGTHHSPHYIFHSALSDLRNAEQMFSVAEANAAVRSALAANVTWLWKHFDDDFEAGAYLADTLAARRVFDRGQIEIRDVPTLRVWLEKLGNRAKAELSNEAYLSRIDAALAAVGEAADDEQ